MKNPFHCWCELYGYGSELMADGYELKTLLIFKCETLANINLLSSIGVYLK